MGKGIDPRKTDRVIELNCYSISHLGMVSKLEFVSLIHFFPDTF